MMKVSQILAGKSANLVYAVRPDQMVIEALELMAARNIGAVMVMENARLVGIFSERDYARKGILQDRKAKSTPVSEVMTPNVITVGPKDSIEDCMRLMSERHFRHLPVVEDSQVVGLVSISDVVKVIIEEQKGRIENLEKYITGY
jgi:CBS domain-containing protein